MAGKKNTSLDRVLGRLDTLDSVNLANLVQRLARERGLFEEIFNTLQEGVLVIDPDGIIDYANESAHSLIGVREDDLEGDVLWKYVPGLKPSLVHALDNDETSAPVVASREFELTYPKPRTLRLNMVPFKAGAKELKKRYVVILSDITREKQATGQLIEDEKTSSLLLLAGGVAHELGNPLNSLTIHLQLMERKLKKLKAGADSESIAESVKICRDEVQRLDGIIKNFLEAIRPQDPDLLETNIEDVLTDVLKVQKQEIADRGIILEAKTSHALPVILADKNQIKQVFFNLTKNAMEAMQPGGKLKIRTGVDDERVYVLFADTGSGIKQEDIIKLFQPYHTTKVGGHGLGLMIVQRIMRAHGGQVGVESKEGVGTVVTLQFPRKDKRVRMLHGGS